MEGTVNKEYASKGVAGTGLGIAIGSAVLGLLNNNGGLGGILGGGCGGNAYVNRYEAEQSAKIAALEADIKLRDANTYTMQEMAKLRDYVEHKFDKVDERLCKQAEWNAAQTAALSCQGSQIQQLFGLTKLVIPNPSVCPGWGAVTVAPATTTTTTTTP